MGWGAGRRAQRRAVTVSVAFAWLLAVGSVAAQQRDGGGSGLDEPDAGVAGEPELNSPELLSEDSALEDELDLERLLTVPVVSAASRTAESATDAPATTWVISGTDLRRYGIQSVEEAIRYLGHGMTSYEFDNRLNTAFGARGYMSDNLGLHIAVLIDGNQAGGSSKTARGGQQYLMPIELVDHIEVVIGPGSVVYGNSAMLGVINVVTRSASSIEGENVVVQGSAGLPADKWAKDVSWGESWGRTAAYGATKFQLGEDPFELVWHAAVRWDRQLGRAVWRRVREGVDVFAEGPSAYTREDVFNRDLGARLFARGDWGKWKFLAWTALSGGTGLGPIEASGRSSYLEPEYGFDAKWSTQIGDRGDLSLRAYAVVFDSRVTTVPNVIDEQRCLDTVGTSACADTLNYVSIKPFFEPIFAWDWNQDGTHVTTFGGQLFVDGSVITSGVTERNGRTLSDPPIFAPLPNAAAYAQHIWRGDFGSLNLGVRGDVGILGQAVSPRAAYNRKLGDDTTLKFIFSTGFRTPVITERYLEIDNFLTSNENIKPERVYSAEVDLAQRLGRQNLQFALYGAFWDQLITVRGVTVNGQALNQFQNAHRVWSAGINAGWQGSQGPLDWGVSLNYAPGRRLLPRGVLTFSDEQLAEARLRRNAVDRYGWRAFNNIFIPADAMPDAYGTAHVSLSLGEGLPRLSLAGHVNSPRPIGNYSTNAALVDPRNVDGPILPWSVDVRGAVEVPVSDRVGFRLTMTGRSIATVASPPRIGDLTAPVPQGGIGTINNPASPLSAMAEVSVRL